jgi:hypothetical protein
LRPLGFRTGLSWAELAVVYGKPDGQRDAEGDAGANAGQ